jgi:glycosyltransferase involved in cell wall biosynthesis
MNPAKPSIDVDVFGSTAGANGWTTHSVSFAQSLNELTPVSFRAGRRAALRGLFGPLRGPLLRGLRSARSDFGVVISGKPLYPDHSARWIVWETTVLPDAQRELCDSTQFLWTPSTWGRQNLIANGIEASRVAVIPEGVDTDFFRPVTRAPGRFRFLMVGKWERRKFSEGLLRAFTEEFIPSEDVELYLHAHNPFLPNFSLKDKVEQAGFSDAGNVVLGEPCTVAALRQLYQSADCFVLPTRAEGWGLPILESMACGVPAIVTRHSAPVDYVSDENGYLLDVAQMVEAHDEDFNIHTGLWAEPDIAHLRHLMRTAFQNREQLIEKGRMARLTAEQFTWKNSAKVALDTIHQHLSP